MDSRLYPLFEHLLGVFRLLWLPVAIFAYLWWSSSGSTSFYFPPLQEILSTLWTDLTAGQLLRFVGLSLANLGIGIAIAIVLGVASGLLIGEFDEVRRIATPTLNFLRAVPPPAIIPIVIIAMGVGPTPKIFLIVLSCFWPILLNTIDGVRGTSASVRETARAYKIPVHLVVFRVALPAATPQIMAGIRVALAVALVVMVVSEFFGADAGIGFYISDASTRFATRQAWAGTILVGVLGYLLSAGFLLVERRVLAWYFQDTKWLHRRLANAPGRKE